MKKVNRLFQEDLAVVNVGLETFYTSMRSIKVPTVHVEWKPAAGGDEKLMAILDRLK